MKDTHADCASVRGRPACANRCLKLRQTQLTSLQPTSPPHHLSELASPHLTIPHLTQACLTTAHLTSCHHTSPQALSPHRFHFTKKDQFQFVQRLSTRHSTSHKLLLLITSACMGVYVCASAYVCLCVCSNCNSFANRK